MLLIIHFNFVFKYTISFLKCILIMCYEDRLQEKTENKENILNNREGNKY